jgi:hypothetical protein
VFFFSHLCSFTIVYCIYYVSERYGSFLFSSNFGVSFNDALEPLAFHIWSKINLCGIWLWAQLKYYFFFLKMQENCSFLYIKKKGNKVLKKAEANTRHSLRRPKHAYKKESIES